MFDFISGFIFSNDGIHRLVLSHLLTSCYLDIGCALKQSLDQLRFTFYM